MLESNALYHVDVTRPEFDRVEPGQVEPAMRAMLAEAEEAVVALEAGAEATWESLCEPLHRATEPLWLGWGMVGHFMSVMNTDAWREAHEALQPEMVTFGLRVAQSVALFEKLKALKSGGQWAALNGPRRRIVENAVLRATLAGVGLAAEQRERFNEIQQELSKLGTTFSNHLLDATKAFALTLTEKSDVAGLPASLLAASAQAARDAGEASATAENGPWRVTLEASIMGPFLQYCERRELREQLYRAYVTRASSGELDNRPVMVRILELRREKAQMLGYANYGELSLATKMASGRSY